jgi:hypothetical protein
MNHYSLVDVEPDWRSGEVDFVAPPTITVTIAPNINFADRYPIQSGVDDRLQEINLNTSSVERQDLSDMTRAYSIGITDSIDAEVSQLRFTFPGARRSDLASLHGETILAKVVNDTLTSLQERGQHDSN